MKIRTSFVTNSSSSSFIVAHNNQFTPEQKERLVEFALKNFLGDVTCSTKEELVKYFNETHSLDLKVGEFTDENSNLKDLFDDSGSLKDEFVEDYDGCCTEVYRFMQSLKAIKQGNSVSLGWLRFEDDIPIGTLMELQKTFGKLSKAITSILLKMIQIINKEVLLNGCTQKSR